jgi:hypothetical protein
MCKYMCVQCLSQRHGITPPKKLKKRGMNVEKMHVFVLEIYDRLHVPSVRCEDGVGID